MAKTETNDDAKAILINNLVNYFYNNGMGAFDPNTGDDGLVMKSNGGQTMFAEGVVWGGYQRGMLKVNGAAYSGGLQAGPIIANGTQTSLPVAANGTDSRYHVYRVRPDITPATPPGVAMTILMTGEIPYLPFAGMTVRQFYDLYVKDWNDWPGGQGAPYTDVNHNGVYEPTIDIPGVPGADQTLWYVANDVDSARTKRFAGSLPIGLEVQKTVWAYHRPGALDNTIFQRTRLINKSGVPVDSMFIMQFSDPDIGGSLGYTDDNAGTDTVRQMGFVYNGMDKDGFFGAHPPAVGMMLLAGPAVHGSAADSAFVNFSYRKGTKNLPMTSLVAVIKTVDEPATNTYRGTTEYYNLMKGLLKTGTPLVNPETGRVTTFVFPGDPVTKTGWIEGDRYNTSGTTYYPGDRRLSFSSGPFTMAPADTQEIVIAEMVGIGEDRFGSIEALRSNADAVRRIFRNSFSLPAALPVPSAHATGWDRHILIDWTDSTSFAAAEAYASAGYRFQGYNVYQLPNGDITKAKRILTSDVIDDVAVVIDTVYDAASNLIIASRTAFGTNSGLRHYYASATDSLTGAPMVNGTHYYYAVTSYAYNPSASAGTKVIESVPVILDVIPQQPLPGLTIPTVPGQIISRDPSRVHGGNLNVFVTVIDPAKVTGHMYAVLFTNTTASSPWSVYDSTAKKFIIKDQTHYSLLSVIEAGNPYYQVNDPADPIADGLQFTVGNRYSPYTAQWSISTAGLEPHQYSVQKAAQDVERINVYPNPYFAGNTQESNKYEHFVTFNHLPQKAVINIHTLTGVRVRVLVKDDQSQFLKWDLTNESGAQVAAGMYVVYISLPELGTQKILKLAVIPAVTIPDHW
jgi:hypothetical protein